jgi:hypothetical protein
VPADRFFGVESAVRAAIESRLAQNELLMALEQSPRKPVYLVGQIDGQPVSLHGERGRLVITTPQGGRQEVGMEDMGGLLEGGPREEESDGDVERGGAAGAAGQANPGASSGSAALAGEGDLGGGERRAEGQCAQQVHGDPGAVAGAQDGARGGERFAGEPSAGLAAVAICTVGAAGGAAEATTRTWTIGMNGMERGWEELLRLRKEKTELSAKLKAAEALIAVLRGMPVPQEPSAGEAERPTEIKVRSLAAHRTANEGR